MEFKFNEKPLDVSEVEDAASIVKRFATGKISGGGPFSSYL